MFSVVFVSGLTKGVVVSFSALGVDDTSGVTTGISAGWVYTRVGLSLAGALVMKVSVAANATPPPIIKVAIAPDMIVGLVSFIGLYLSSYYTPLDCNFCEVW